MTDVDWDHSLRCPHCDGLNDLAAEWCMQCHERLRSPAEKVDLNEGAPTARDLVTGALDVVAGDPHAGFDEGIGKAFVHQGDSVTWTCGKCAHRNDIRQAACEDCGTPFAASARLIADAEMPQKKSRAFLKATGIVLGGSVLMRLVAGLISPWAAVGLLGGAMIRALVRLLRD